MYALTNYTQAYCKKCYGSERFPIGTIPNTTCPTCNTTGRIVSDIIFSCQHQYDTGTVVARGETVHTCKLCNHKTTMLSDD